MTAVIPSNRSRKSAIRHDEVLYRERDRIERCFKLLQQAEAFSTPRYPL